MSHGQTLTNIHSWSGPTVSLALAAAAAIRGHRQNPADATHQNKTESKRVPHLSGVGVLTADTDERRAQHTERSGLLQDEEAGSQRTLAGRRRGQERERERELSDPTTRGGKGSVFLPYSEKVTGLRPDRN